MGPKAERPLISVRVLRADTLGRQAVRASDPSGLKTDVTPFLIQPERESRAVVKCSPKLGQPWLEISGVKAHAGMGAGEPFMSDIGGLLPMALCGRTSL